MILVYNHGQSWSAHFTDLRPNMANHSFAIARPLLAISLLIAFSTDAWALRCGNRLVKEGMYETEVIELCGDPVSVTDLGYVLRPYIVKRPAGNFGHRSTKRVYGGYHQELAVREMLFNFGPHKLMRIIRFEGGRLTTISTVGYGYLEKKP